MRLAVLAAGPTLEHLIAACHRQAVYVLSIDTETMEYEAKSNDPKLLESPLGKILFAKLLAQEGITSLITGYCDDSLYHILDAEGINVTTGQFGFVYRAIRRYHSSAPAATA